MDDARTVDEGVGRAPAGLGSGKTGRGGAAERGAASRAGSGEQSGERREDACGSMETPHRVAPYNARMTLGVSPKHDDMFQSSRAFCEDHLAEASIFRLLAEEGQRLFPDEAFADLFKTIGRRCIAPRIVAAVMVLQRLEGLSDREATERFLFDVRWKYAAGVPSDFPGFVHTVLVDMRERLRHSKRPDRIFDIVLDLAKQAGLVGRKRVLDSTALYDAVATQDTVTLIRGAIRGVLRVAGGDTALASELRSVLRRDDDYTSAGKPACDWDDGDARTALVDALARDGYALLAALDGRALEPALRQAAELLLTVTGQDLERTDDGTFRIARRVAKDRVISTVDPDARHGHKTDARRFDGYKGHIAIDPDSEIITATHVTAGNIGDADAAPTLLHEVLTNGPIASEPSAESSPGAESRTGASVEASPPEIYGDASYGSAALLEVIEFGSAIAEVKVQPPSAPLGCFSQDKFTIDVHAGTVTCPNGILVKLRRNKDDSSTARFGAACALCPIRAQCTSAKDGRLINVHPKYELLDRHRKRHADPENKRRYRATRPKVERKIAHLMRRRHGGRRARVRGCVRVAQDFALLAAATNLARLARLRIAAKATPANA